MFAIIDHRAPEEVKKNLSEKVQGVFEFSSSNVTYNSVSGHPDIFIFQHQNELIIAPNSPQDLITFLDENRINYRLGNNPVGESLKESTWYNTVCSDEHIYAKEGSSDQTILNVVKSKTPIHLSQAYTRCSMLPVGDGVITSDGGIAKRLKEEKIDHFLFDPKQIKIVDHKYGFLGGTCGILEDTVCFMGNALLHSDGEALVKYIENKGYKVEYLGSDYLYDGGGIFFVSQ